MTRTGKGLSQGVIKVGSLIIDSRLKVGACLWLADKYDKDFGEVLNVLKGGKVKDVINLIVALAIQHDADCEPDLKEKEVRKVINQLDLDELGVMAASITSALETDAKNSKRPISGNLEEQNS